MTLLYCYVVQQGDTLEMVGDTVSGMARCPYDPKHANVALFAGKKHVSHTILQAHQATVSQCCASHLFTASHLL